MSTYSVADFQRSAQQRMNEIEQELREVQQKARQHFERKTELTARRDQAEMQLVSTILTAFTPEALDRARAITGFQPLNAGLIEAMYQERRQLQERVAQIEADDRFLDRERLRHPDSGELALAMQRINEHRKALAPLVDKCRSNKRFEHLIEVGYGTSEYKVGFWRVSYYLDWKAGDEVMELFPDKKSFKELREEYLENSRALADLDPRLQELQREWDAGVKLENDYNEATYRLANLEALHLDEARKSLGQFLADCPEGALASRLERHPELETMAKRWAGLQEQVRYLERANELVLTSLLNDLSKEKDKLQKDYWKYSRPKNAYVRFPEAAFQSRFAHRREKVRKRLDRYGTTVETIYVFDDYDRGSLAENFLWWDLVTDGQIDGNFMPEVQQYYQRHPGYRYERRRHDDSEAAAASVSSSSSTSYDDAS